MTARSETSKSSWTILLISGGLLTILFRIISISSFGRMSSFLVLSISAKSFFDCSSDGAEGMRFGDTSLPSAERTRYAFA